MERSLRSHVVLQGSVAAPGPASKNRHFLPGSEARATRSHPRQTESRDTIGRMSVEDSQLLERWRAGEVAAGEALFERYYNMIERFFLNKLATDINDLVQETFIACVERRDDVRDTSKFRSYLFSVAYNVLRAHLRRNYWQGQNIEFDKVALADLSPGPNSIIVNRDEQRLLLEGLRNIPVGYQMVLELHYWEGMTTAQIGEVLGVPASTARTRLRRARDHLEAAMRSLSDSAELLQSTLVRLDDWARQIRDYMQELDGRDAGAS